MNSVVTRGRAEVVVSATGRSTEMGRIAGMLETTDAVPTPLQVQLHHLAKRLALIAVVVVAAISAVELLRGDSLAQMAIEGVALAVAAVPEGLPAVVTVTLALGLHRMAQHRAIVKRLAAVETLGCTTVICSDKTGTLTHEPDDGSRSLGRGATVPSLGRGLPAGRGDRLPRSPAAPRRRPRAAAPAGRPLQRQPRSATASWSAIPRKARS